MKKMFKQFMQSLVLGGLFPALMISAISNAYGNTVTQDVAINDTTQHREITVINKSGETCSMDLETYITSVILGEVSTQFHSEALKAQAVAARTYALYCIEVLKKHNVGAVCTDYSCCQAYCETEEYLNNGGTAEGLNKVKNAVKDTAGEVMYYDGRLVCATYFASSGGQTEDALEVWGKSYPYLRSVKSPGEEDCGYFNEQVRLTSKDLTDALGARLVGDPSSWFGMVKYSAGGGIDLMRIGGRIYTGVELRRLLKLRSTIMTVCVTDDEILIDTKGYGHRVGMSQHGANAMAKKGSDYRRILGHYYTGVDIQQPEN